MIKRVDFSNKLEKELRRQKGIPERIRRMLYEWVEQVKERGLYEVRKDKCWNDEDMKGDLKGKRKIWLDYQWRAIYVIKKDQEIEFVSIEKVTPHEFRH